MVLYRSEISCWWWKNQESWIWARTLKKCAPCFRGTRNFLFIFFFKVYHCSPTCYFNYFSKIPLLPENVWFWAIYHQIIWFFPWQLNNSRLYGFQQWVLLFCILGSFFIQYHSSSLILSLSTKAWRIFPQSALSLSERVSQNNDNKLFMSFNLKWFIFL
jgi:hypothetical protein